MNINLSKEIIKGGRHHGQRHKHEHKHRHGYANSYSPYNNQGVIYQNRQAELSLPLMPYGVYDSSTMFYGYQGLTPYGVYNYPPLMIIPSPLGALTDICGTKKCIKEGTINITGSGVLLLLYRGTPNDATEKYYALLVKSTKDSKWSDMGGHVQNNNGSNKIEGNALKELKEESKCLFTFNSMGANSFFIDILDETAGGGATDCFYRCYIIKIQLTDDILKYLKKYFEYNTLQLSHPNYTFNPEYKETSDIAGFPIDKCTLITGSNGFASGHILHDRTQICLFILNFVDIYNKTVKAFTEYGKLMDTMGDKMIATGVASLGTGTAAGGVVKTAGGVAAAAAVAADMKHATTTTLITAIAVAVAAAADAAVATAAAAAALAALPAGAKKIAADALKGIQKQLADIAPQLTDTNEPLKILKDMNAILTALAPAPKLAPIEEALFKAKKQITSTPANHHSVNLHFDHYTNFYTMQL